MKVLKRVTRVPLYPASLMVVFTNNVDAITEYFEGFTAPTDIYGHTCFSEVKMVDDSKEICIVIIINPWNEKPFPLSAITHEASHAAGMILQHVGILADWENDEPFAYLADWVASQVFKFISDEKLIKKFPLVLKDKEYGSDISKA